jgi:tetratricopeptide (TPR) repeat protein
VSPLPALTLAAVVSSFTDEAASRRAFDEAVSRQIAGKWDDAASRYRELLAKRPELVAARVYLSETLWLGGESEAASRELHASIEAAPSLLLPHLLLVRFGGKDTPTLARRIPDASIRSRLLENILLEGERFVHVGRPAILLLSMGRIESAAEDYREATAADLWNVEMHRQAGNAFFKASRSVEAVSAFEKVVALAPDDASAWGQLGSSYLRLQWWDPAIQAFEKAMELEGEKPGGLLALGYAYERKPDFEKALALYERAASIAPKWPQAPYRIGRVFIKLDRLDDAEKALKRALELDPKMAEASCFLGAVHLEKRDLAGATEILERTVATDPKFAKAYFYLGQAYQRAGRAEEARAALASYTRLTAQEGYADPP